MSEVVMSEVKDHDPSREGLAVGGAILTGISDPARGAFHGFVPGCGTIAGSGPFLVGGVRIG